MKLEKRTIQIGNLPPVTHYGSEEAYKKAHKRLLSEMQVKVNETEKAKSRQSYEARFPMSPAMVDKAKDVYLEGKRLQYDRAKSLAAVRDAITEMTGAQCSWERAATLITMARKKYGINKIKFGSEE